MHLNPSTFLPTSVKEMKVLGWDVPDVILFTGDAYIDHPSFGGAVIARWLEKLGLKVAVVPQPNWRDDLRDFKKFGTPRLFFAVTGGNMDSMVNHYTANKRLRSDDAFTPGGKAGARPDYAVTVYTKILKNIFPQIPVIIGGVEASLRRLTHYDYWSDALKPSILIESGADLLVYGMGEKPLKAIVKKLLNGQSVETIKEIPQTAFVVNSVSEISTSTFTRNEQLLSYENCLKDKINYAKNFRVFEEESNREDAARLIEPTDDKFVIVNPPYIHYTQEEIDAPYDLPFQRVPHPRYYGKEAIPAYEMIRDSVNIHRGCFGACSFCTISAHQGKNILSRSEKSIVNEIKNLIKTPGFKGNLSDLGGPSANMYKMEGIDKSICAKCKRPSCISPSICKNLNANHKPLMELYQKVSSIEGIKRVFIGSGIRYDLLYNLPKAEMQTHAQVYFKELVKNHVSGRLKVAPEHSAPHVLKIMRKPSFDLFIKFKSDFDSTCKQLGMKQQVIPYLISSHPGSTVVDMAELASTLQKIGYTPEQVQDFTPTPMTLATAIYYTGVSPYTLEPIASAKTIEEKKLQQAFFFFYKPENRMIIKNHLSKIGRNDLIKRIFVPIFLTYLCTLL